MQENRAGNKLTRSQNKAILALLSTNTREAAAKAAGVCERTLYKYLADPIFRAELLEQEQILRRESGRRLAKDNNYILNLLFDFIDNRSETDDSVWLRAIALWLDYHHKTESESDLERRVTALEARDDERER